MRQPQQFEIFRGDHGVIPWTGAKADGVPEQFAFAALFQGLLFAIEKTNRTADDYMQVMLAGVAELANVLSGAELQGLKMVSQSIQSIFR